MIGIVSSLVTATIVSSFQRHVRAQHLLSDHYAEMKGHNVHKLAAQLSITQNSSHAQTPPSSLDSNFGFASPRSVSLPHCEGGIEGGFVTRVVARRPPP